MHSISVTIELLKAYFDGTIHPDNHPALKAIFEKYPDLRPMVDKLEQPAQIKSLLATYGMLSSTAESLRAERILHNLLETIQASSAQPRPSFKQRIKPFYGYVAAACLLVALGVGLWQYPRTTVDPDKELLVLAQEFVPGGNRATLSSSDGTSLALNEDRMGIVMGKDITYDDGSILLADKADKAPILTLSTPKGGQYQISLADGTKVWLNADSKLRYPKTFSGVQRRVELDGEAYFEVAQHSNQTFVVRTSQEEVEVLGTHFNVNAYKNDLESKVSLLEGKVKVSLSNTNNRMLQPGQQTVVKDGAMRVQPVNLEESIAWKNGEFMFNNEPLGTALRQVARWYAIEIEVDPALAGITLWGTVSRFESFDKVLKIIKMTDDNIKINLDGRRVRLMK